MRASHTGTGVGRSRSETLIGPNRIDAELTIGTAIKVKLAFIHINAAFGAAGRDFSTSEVGKLLFTVTLETGIAFAGIADLIGSGNLASGQVVASVGTSSAWVARVGGG